MSKFYLSDLSEKDKPWDFHRALADQVRDIYAGTEFDKYSDRLAACARFLQFALCCDDLGKVSFRLQEARFCRVPRCPVCQWRRSLMWKARFFKALPEISAAYPTARWVFLTLTVRNVQVEDLRTTVAWMNKSWLRLSQRKIFPAQGYIKSVEVTRNNEKKSAWYGTSHPHLHILMMVPAGYFKTGKYINQKKWVTLWRQALGVDYDPTVDVKAVKSKSKVSEDSSVNLRDAIAETMKYTVQPSHLVSDSEWFLELTRQLYKTRAISIGGCLRSYFSEQEDDNSDLIHADEDESEVSPDDPRWWFGWREYVKRYAKIDPL